MKNIDLVKAMISLTGGTLPEVLALTALDIVPADHGNITIHIGLGNRRRTVFVHDDTIPLQLLDATLLEKQHLLFEEAVSNFDDTPHRSMFAKRLYQEYAHNGEENYEDYDSGTFYDHLSLKLVARTMGISVNDVVFLLNQ